MKRPQITPGPWKLSEDEMKVFQTSNVYNSEGQTITLGSSALPQLERKANAKAIAALPSLLEALELQSQIEGPSMTLLYDEEGVEGWQWEHPATGQTWTAIGQHDEPAPFFPPVESALKLAGYEF